MNDTTTAEPGFDPAPSQTFEPDPPVPPVEPPASQQALVPAAAAPSDWGAARALLANKDALPLALYLDPDIKQAAWGLAGIFCRSQWVPAHFRGPEKQGDCFIGLHYATRLGEDPVTVLQNCYIVQGKPGLEAKFLIQLVNRRGPFKSGVRFVESGTKPVAGKDPSDDYAVTAYGTFEDGERAEFTVSIATAKAEGWYSRNPKYRSSPRLMLSYRAASGLQRLYCPEVTMGAYIREELEELPAAAAPQAVPLASPKPLGLKVTSSEEAADAELS